jgi:predicted acetyltransferase
MRLRKAGSGDARDLAELWSHAFPGERSVADRVRQLETGIPYGGLETARLLEEHGRIAAALRLYRLTQYFGGVALPMMGLAAVAVAPDARRRGLGREICREALRLARDDGDVVSALYPFRPAFYHSLGWGLTGTLHSYRFRPEALPRHEGGAAVRLATSRDRSAIAACYARVAEASNGLLRRDERCWLGHLDVVGVHAFVHDAGGVRGYILATYGRSRSPERRLFRIRELIAEDRETYRALLGWLSDQRDQWRRIHYDASPDEAFDRLLMDPRPPHFRPARALWFPAGQRIRGPMLRVLDVGQALEARTGRHGLVSNRELTLRIEIDDAELPENRGPWSVTLHDVGSTVRKTTPASADARLVTDAPTFAQIFAGDLAPSAAARLGLAVVEGALTLDRVFRTNEGFRLLDEF